MSGIIREQPALYFEGKAKDRDQVVEEFSASFFHFSVDLSKHCEEMSDAELLSAAEAAGTFQFWDDDGENIYKP